MLIFNSIKAAGFSPRLPADMAILRRALYRYRLGASGPFTHGLLIYDMFRRCG